MTESLFEESCRYVGFGPEDEAALADLRDSVPGALPALIENFYHQVDLHRGAREVFTDPVRQRPKLARTLAAWIKSTFAGPYDEGYALRRQKIGRVHVAQRLPQRYMVTGMSIVRAWGVDLCLARYPTDPARRAAGIAAVNKILDVELVLMLSTYQDALLAQAQRQGRMATVGALSAGLHSALRNPLASIEVLVFALAERKSLQADPRAQEMAVDLQGCVGEAREVLTDLLSFSALEQPGEEFADLDTVMAAVRSRVEFPSGSEFTLDVDPTLPPVPVAPRRLEQLILNLVENAAEACVQGENLGVRARKSEGHLVITVWDEGEGIRNEDMTRLEAPFFTTRPHRLGIGLPLCRHLVESEEGRLEIQSERGRGTTVVVSFRL